MSTVFNPSRRLNSYRQAAPVAVTLDMLYKHLRRAKRELHGKDGPLPSKVSDAYNAVLSLDRELKKASRFQPSKASQKLYNLCGRFLAMFPDHNDGYTSSAVYNELIGPVRQIASDRLSRLEQTKVA